MYFQESDLRVKNEHRALAHQKAQLWRSRCLIRSLPQVNETVERWDKLDYIETKIFAVEKNQC